MIANVEQIQLALDSIRTDGGTQPRINQDWKIIDEYAQDMREGANFPPVIAFFDGDEYWLADGFHRYHAAKQAEKETIAANVKQGSLRDAILFSVSVNAHHGFRRTNADKRAVVEKLLKDEEWSKWSDREIARRCDVSHDFVSRLRPAICHSMTDSPRYVERGGTIYTMNSANIGQQQENTLSRQFPDQFYHDIAQDVEHVSNTWMGTKIGHVDEELQKIEEPYQPIVKSATLTALQSSDSNEWYTPAQYVNAARELMGSIDLDPASNERANEIIQATNYYDINTNGLSSDWRGRVWLNPPYGFTNGESNQFVWSGRLIDQFKNGITTEAVLLVNANTEAKWFQPLYDYLICFTNHRIRFYSSNGESSQPTQGNALIYLGPEEKKQRFIALFREFGAVVERCQ